MDSSLFDHPQHFNPWRWQVSQFNYISFSFSSQDFIYFQRYKLFMLIMGWNWYCGAAKQWKSWGNKQLFHAVWGRTPALPWIRTSKSRNGCFYSPFGPQLPLGIGWTRSSFCFAICGIPQRFTHQSEAPAPDMINSCSCMYVIADR